MHWISNIIESCEFISKHSRKSHGAKKTSSSKDKQPTNVVVYQDHGAKDVKQVVVGDFRTETMFIDMDATNIFREFNKRPIVLERGLQSEPPYNELIAKHDGNSSSLNFTLYSCPI